MGKRGPGGSHSAAATHGSIESEGDALAGFGAELLGRPAHDTPAEATIEANRAVVFGQRPHDKSRVAVGDEITLGGLEHPSAKAAALVFRRDIEFENLAAVAQRRHAIAAVTGVAGDRFGKVEDDQSRAAGDGAPPPSWTTADDHSLEFAAGDDPAIASRHAAS